MPLGVSPQGVFVKPYQQGPSGSGMFGTKPLQIGDPTVLPDPGIGMGTKPMPNPARQAIFNSMIPTVNAAGLKPGFPGGGAMSTPITPGMPSVMPVPRMPLVSMPVPQVDGDFSKPMVGLNSGSNGAHGGADKFGSILQMIMSNPQMMQMLFARGGF